jgi:hypothetical protein
MHQKCTKKEKTPSVAAKIVAQAGVRIHDATTRRPPAHSKPIINTDNLEEERGKQFDPRVLDAFKAARPEVIQIVCEFADA